MHLATDLRRTLADHGGRQARGLQNRLRGAVEVSNVADFDRQDVQELLRDWGLQSAERCIALWPWDRARLELPSETFVQHYDELW